MGAQFSEKLRSRLHAVHIFVGRLLLPQNALLSSQNAARKKVAFLEVKNALFTLVLPENARKQNAFSM